MTPKREGPKLVVIVSVSCEGCQHLDSRYYSVEDGNSYDWGYTHHCMRNDGARIGHGDTMKTPKWCPFYPTELPKARWPD